MKRFCRKMLFFTFFAAVLAALSLFYSAAETYPDDASAVAAGAVARIGDEGKDGYCTSLSDALCAAADGDTVTVLTDTVLSPVTLTKNVTIDGQGFCVTRANTADTDYLLTLSGCEATLKNLCLNSVILKAVQTTGTSVLNLTDGTEICGKTAAYGALISGNVTSTVTIGTGCSARIINGTANASSMVIDNAGILHLFGAVSNATDSSAWQRCISTNSNTLTDLYLYEGSRVELATTTPNSSSCAILLYGNLVMTGGEVTAAAGAGSSCINITGVLARTVQISGGKITCSAASPAVRVNAACTVILQGTAAVSTAANGASNNPIAVLANATVTVRGNASLSAAHTCIRMSAGTLTLGGNASVVCTAEYAAAVRLTAGSPTLIVQENAVITANYAPINAAGSGSPKVYLQGGMLTGGKYGYLYDTISGGYSNDGTPILEISGGALIANAGDAVRFSCSNQAENAAQFMMSGGELHGKSQGIRIQGATNLKTVITGGTLTVADNLFLDEATSSGKWNILISGIAVTGKNGFYLRSTAGGQTAVDMENCTFSMTAYVIRLTAGTATVNISNSVMETTAATAICLGETAGATAILTMNTCTVRAAKYGVYCPTDSTVTGTLTGCDITAGERAISTTSGTILFTINGGNYRGNVYPVSFACKNGSKITVNGGNFIAGSNADAAFQIYGSSNAHAIGADVTATINGGYFYGEKVCCVRAAQSAHLIIMGGVFEYGAPEEGTGAPVRSGAGANAAARVDVFGGIFTTTYLYNAVFSTAEGANGAACELNVYAYTVTGGAGVIRNDGKGTGYVAYDANRDRASHMTPVMQSGAGVRFAEGSNGLRFLSEVSAETVAYIESIADPGTTIRYGTVIAPADYAARARIFSAEFLTRAGLKFLDIKAENGLIRNADGSLTIRAAIVNILPENLTRAFAAASYVEYTVNGVASRMYSAYQYDLHSRSAEQVARLALADASKTYTDAQLAVLTGYFDPQSEMQKTLDVYLIAGQSNAAGSTYMTEEFAASNSLFANGYENIYYSGNSRTTAASNKFGVHKLNNVQPTKAGLGKTSLHMGPELGMAKVLSGYYNAITGKEAAIIKYGTGGTRLMDHLSDTNSPEGNWTPPSYLAAYGAAGERSGGLYRNFISLVEETVAYYRVLGYTDIRLMGVFWMQGESDRQSGTVQEKYPELFRLLIQDMRTDLAEIFGADTSSLPVLVGEISKGFYDTISADNLDFIALQNEMVSTVPYTYVLNISDFITGTNAADKSHWTCEDMLLIGEAVGNRFLMLMGKSDLIITPDENDYVAQVFAADGVTALGKYTSLALALNQAPAGATVKLLRDVTLYSSLNVGNQNPITLDGNGYTLTCFAADTAMRVVDTVLTLTDFKLVNKRAGSEAYGITCFAGTVLVFESGSLTCNGAAYGVWRDSDAPAVTVGETVSLFGIAETAN